MLLEMTRKEEVLDRTFAAVDLMSPELRACVHDYGYKIVNAFIQSGVKNPNSIMHLVNTCWSGAASSDNQKRDSKSKALNNLDWILIQNGAKITARRLLAVLRNNHCTIVHLEPTEKMINASLKEVSGGNERMLKSEKHRRRLRVAISAAMTEQFKTAG